jgi:hypothetical protein
MMFDPRATFYYPEELRRIALIGFAVGFSLGAAVSGACFFLLR